MARVGSGVTKTDGDGVTGDALVHPMTATNATATKPRRRRLTANPRYTTWLCFTPWAVVRSDAFRRLPSAAPGRKWRVRGSRSRVCRDGRQLRGPDCADALAVVVAVIGADPDQRPVVAPQLVNDLMQPAVVRHSGPQ